MANTRTHKATGLEALQASLAGEYEVHTLDVHEYPLFLAYAAPLAEGVSGRKPRLPCGRGLTAQDALVGAAAEAIELRASLAHKMPRGRHALTQRDGHDVLSLHALAGDATLTVAAQEVFLDYATHGNEALIKDADSTGCAAGPTLAEARRRGLLECIERDAVATWWYGKQSRAHLPLSLLDPLAPRVSWWLSRRSRRTLLIELTSDVRVPCIAAVSSDNNGLNVAIGSAAAFSTGEAVLSAVLEMLQTEISMQLGSSEQNTELASWQRMASTKTMPQFMPNGTTFTPFEIAHGDLPQRVAAAGLTAYDVEITLPEDPLHTVRVMVPGFSSLNRSINAARIAKACGFPATGVHRFELLEPY